MKRFHVHVGVDDLQKSIRFYSSVFGAEPSVVKDDYAKWMVDDPRINFAVSTRGDPPGLNHLGIQVESEAELEEVRARLVSARAPALEQKGAACCYARSDKHWSVDPQGIAWETFRTLGVIPVYGEDSAGGRKTPSGACCAPECCA